MGWNNEALVFWPTTVHVAALLASTALSIWSAVIARTRRGVPGGAAFSWMMLAVALWSLASALHTVVSDREARIVIAKSQYLAVAPIGVLWLLFTAVYSRVASPLFTDRLLRVAVWIVPLFTFALVLTNERHHLHWAAIEEVETALVPGWSIQPGPGIGCTSFTVTRSYSSAPCYWRAGCGVFRRPIDVRPR